MCMRDSNYSMQMNSRQEISVFSLVFPTGSVCRLQERGVSIRRRFEKWACRVVLRLSITFLKRDMRPNMAPNGSSVR